MPSLDEVISESSQSENLGSDVVHALRTRFALYQELSKSGIVALVLISVFGGYLIGHPFEQPFNAGRLALSLFGILFLASGSSALNQWQERQRDAAMPRTAARPLPSGRLSSTHALAFIGVTLASGLLLLAQLDWAIFGLGLLAVFSYNGLYTLWWKRRLAYAAIPGAVPGALPILMGYAAASGSITRPAGLYLFALLFFWQMPHFWVLALKYRKDYEQGGFPTLPVARGSVTTVGEIVIWCMGYVGLALVAPLFLRVGPLYLAITLAMSAKLLLELRAFVRAPESRKWLSFFLWVNFSLIAYLAAAGIDLWSVYLIPYFTQ